MPQVSVIVPVYKSEKYLKRCVQSILNQKLKDIELILIDDGSPDKSGSICDEFRKLDHRIYVIHQENTGVAAARNAGLKVAKGKYITFVDSDDFIEPDMYEKMLEKAEKYQSDIVMCDCIKDNGLTAIPYTHDIRSGFYNNEQLKKEYYPHLLIMENVEYPATISNCVLLFKTELVNGSSYIRYLNGVRFSEDLLFGAQIMYHATSFYYMKNKYFYHYWSNPYSVTHTFAPDKWNDYKKLHYEIKEYFGNTQDFNFSEQIDKVLLFFVYNAIGDLIGTAELSKREKKIYIRKILTEQTVKDMFHRIRIFKLPIRNRLKILTMCYKYRIGLGILCTYMGGK
ncbi:glycosyltransferase family 2 protein [Anaerostipes faecalis]|uniref:glycosyltransferase family 2 protein n=1 Tax=Anaerostipes faecalis TaxID=2738446 RepID=UPI003F05D458